MGFADNFRELDLLEQAVALQELQARPPVDAISDILPLFITPLGDAATDTMIRNTLRALYLSAPQSVVADLAHTNEAVSALCLDLAGELGLEDVVPQLLFKAEHNADDPDIFSSTVTALTRIHSPATLPFFREHALHKDPLISSQCIKALGRAHDSESLTIFTGTIAANEHEKRYHSCDITTWAAIEALSHIDTPESLLALIQFIHHKNPTARRLILEALVSCGQDAIPLVSPYLTCADRDAIIMAANVLRDIGHADAAGPLALALQQGTPDSNVAFAIYEALGNIPGQTSVDVLSSFLPHEKDPSCILAIVQALDMHVSSATAKHLQATILDAFAARNPQAMRILEAIISARAANLFSFLYEDAVLARLLLELAMRNRDTACQDIFINELKKMNSPRAQKDLAQISPLSAVQDSTRMRLLAIDDSAAMRSFYRTSANAMGLSVTLAGDGQEALDIIEMTPNLFDLIVVDMNMPIMDGIEFTSKLRSREHYSATPVLMATTESGHSQTQLARQSGVTCFLPKPFTQEMLIQKLAEMVENHI